MMATSSASNNNNKGDGQVEGTYECHICFEQAKDAVVSMCGHLFCWPCIHRWMESRPNNPTCPVCKSVIDKAKLIPLYGRGTMDQKDPREKIPPRPQGQREEPQQMNQGNGMDGINISFGIGAFPFTMMGGPMFQAFGNQQQRMPFPRRQNDPQVRADEQRIARVFIMVALLVLILIIFS